VTCIVLPLFWFAQRPMRGDSGKCPALDELLHLELSKFDNRWKSDNTFLEITAKLNLFWISGGVTDQHEEIAVGVGSSAFKTLRDLASRSCVVVRSKSRRSYFSSARIRETQVK
jgi:hypothetical protein